ncbi:polysaccharide biosynthesis/export family protein [Aquibaculum arenosum]|uniref:Polysaccharide export protein n=1 Tax=Aquibaculum arenosum TaxID=3032591 RepID=A0ABT5YLH5_9PROT|nr:polysaccharide biosynthesis/export family protein [Fodinicurvata sp. CAU 1616]MDF2095806.1 polysaccharide export protein [Fodinicurvata sp. CAU 1616]
MARGLSRSLARAFSVLFVLAVLTLSSGPAKAQDAEVYRLGPGDKVRVSVFNEPSLSGVFEVDGSGHVALPLVGEMPARGITVRELEGQLTEVLASGYLVSPKVAIEVINYRPFYIIGEVREPGRYPYVDGMTVMNAVAMAGGYTYRARESRAEIKRQGKDEVDRDASPNATVMPGDVITIPERFF